jgi:hypothetical protein
MGVTRKLARVFAALEELMGCTAQSTPTIASPNLLRDAVARADRARQPERPRWRWPLARACLRTLPTFGQASTHEGWPKTFNVRISHGSIHQNNHFKFSGAAGKRPSDCPRTLGDFGEDKPSRLCLGRSSDNSGLRSPKACAQERRPNVIAVIETPASHRLSPVCAPLRSPARRSSQCSLR